MIFGKWYFAGFSENLIKSPECVLEQNIWVVYARARPRKRTRAVSGNFIKIGFSDEHPPNDLVRADVIRREEGIVLLEIVIQNDGKLKSVKSIKAKFQRLVDSSFDAVELAAPFPVFPKEIIKKRMIIQVPVIYKIR